MDRATQLVTSELIVKFGIPFELIPDSALIAMKKMAVEQLTQGASDLSHPPTSGATPALPTTVIGERPEQGPSAQYGKPWDPFAGVQQQTSTSSVHEHKSPTPTSSRRKSLNRT